MLLTAKISGNFKFYSFENLLSEYAELLLFHLLIYLLIVEILIFGEDIKMAPGRIMVFLEEEFSPRTNAPIVP